MVVTLISFISAAITLSLKDIIFNWFSGIYIRINKPFILEDRIEISGIKGDVININIMNFEVLEVDENVIERNSVEDENSYITTLAHEIKENNCDQEILGLIEKRNELKRNKDYQEADKIREELLSRGIKLVDTKEGTTYEIIK